MFLFVNAASQLSLLSRLTITFPSHTPPSLFRVLKVRPKGLLRHAASLPIFDQAHNFLSGSHAHLCSGFCIAKTNQALMVGVYDDQIQAGNCNTVHAVP